MIQKIKKGGLKLGYAAREVVFGQGMTVNRYAKARSERLVEFAEVVDEIAHDGPENETERAIKNGGRGN